MLYSVGVFSIKGMAKFVFYCEKIQEQNQMLNFYSKWGPVKSIMTGKFNQINYDKKALFLWNQQMTE